VKAEPIYFAWGWLVVTFTLGLSIGLVVAIITHSHGGHDAVNTLDTLIGRDVRWTWPDVTPRDPAKH
jgi:hypothetical protein